MSLSPFAGVPLPQPPGPWSSCFSVYCHLSTNRGTPTKGAMNEDGQSTIREDGAIVLFSVIYNLNCRYWRGVGVILEEADNNKGKKRKGQYRWPRKGEGKSRGLKLVQHGKRKELEEAVMKKRRCLIDLNEGLKLIEAEPGEFGDHSAFEVSDLEALALEMQGCSRAKRNQEEVPNDLDGFVGGDRELDEEF